MVTPGTRRARPGAAAAEVVVLLSLLVLAQALADPASAAPPDGDAPDGGTPALTVPVMVPARPDPGVPGAPDVTAFGWRTAPGVGGFRVDLRLGETVAVAPFPSLGDDPRCHCEHRQLTCSVLDDGSLRFRLEDPTRLRARPSLGACTVGDHAVEVRAAPPALPPPFEAAPGRWVVPVRPGDRGPQQVLWLPRARGWAPAGDACTITPGSRRDGVVRLAAPSDAWVPCVRHRSGQVLEARTLAYRLPWEPPAEAP